MIIVIVVLMVIVAFLVGWLIGRMPLLALIVELQELQLENAIDEFVETMPDEEEGDEQS